MADTDIAFEMYKMEYEKAAERYNNIYQQVWTNFNYLLLLSGGILAFSNNVKFVPTWAKIVLAALPLLYWYVAVFAPGNRYGDGVVKSLARVEKILNEMYADKLDFSLLSPPSSPPFDWGLRHFTDFDLRRRTQPSRLNLVTRLTQGIENYVSRTIGDSSDRARLFPPSVRTTTFVAAVSLSVVVAALGWRHRNDPPEDKKDSITIEQTDKQLEVKISNVDVGAIRNLLQNSTPRREDLNRLESKLDVISGRLDAIEKKHPGQPR